MSLEEQDMTAEVATEVVTSEPVSEKKPVSSVATSIKTATSTAAQMPEDVPAGKEEVVVVKEEEEEGAAPAAVFKDAASLKESLRAVVEKLLSKQNLQTDLALVQHMNAQMFVPLAYLAQHSQVQCLTSDAALIEEALRGSEYLTVADEGVKPNIKVERNTIVLRDVPTGTSEAKLQEVFSFDGCPQVKSIRADVANTWFVSMCSEEDAKKTIEALRDVTLEGAPLYARLKSENPMRSLLASHASSSADSPANAGAARGLDGRGYFGGRVFGSGYVAYPMAMSNGGFPNGYQGTGARGYGTMNARGEPRTFVSGRAYNPNAPQAANGYRGSGSAGNGGRGAQAGAYGYRARDGVSGPSSATGAAAGSPQQAPLVGQAGAAGRGSGKENGKPQQLQQQPQAPTPMLGPDGQPLGKKAAKAARRKEREAAEAMARQKAGQGSGADGLSGSTASDNGHSGGRAGKKWDEGKAKADRRKAGEGPHEGRGKGGSQRDAAPTYGEGNGGSESGPASTGHHGEGAMTGEGRATAASEGIILTNSIAHFPPLPGTLSPSSSGSSRAEGVAEAGDSTRKKDEGAAASGLAPSGGKLFEEKQYAAALLRDPARVTSPAPGPQTPRGEGSTATASARETGVGEGEALDRVASSEQRPQPAGPGAREEGSSGSSSSKRDEAAPTGAAESGARNGVHGSGPEPAASPAKPTTGAGSSNSSVGAETQTEPASGVQQLGANRPVTELSWSSEPRRGREHDQPHALASSPSQSQPCHRHTQPSGSAEGPEGPSKRVLHGSWAAAVMHGPPVPPKGSAPLSPPLAPSTPTAPVPTAPLAKPTGASKDVGSPLSSLSSSQSKPERKDASSASRGPSAKGPRNPRGEGAGTKAHPRTSNASSRRNAHVSHDDSHGLDADNDDEEATSAGGGAEGAVQGGKQALKCAPPSSWGNKPTFVEILRAKQEAAAAAAIKEAGVTAAVGTPVA